MIRYARSEQFRKSYNALPAEIQEKAKKAFSLFKDNRNHPSLGVKKIKGTQDIWEGRIDLFYRFTFRYYKDEKGDLICQFLNIGPHSIVEQQ